MVSTLREGHIEWTMPAPLWPQIGDASLADNRLLFRTPALLRFATDTFMQELLDLLATDPHRLGDYLAAPETWSSPFGEPIAPVAKSGLALKLQQARNIAVKRLAARGSTVIGGSLSTTSAAASNPLPTRPLKLFQPSHGRFYLVSTCLVCRTVGLPDRRIDAGAQERASFVIRLLQPRPGANQTQPDPRDCDEFALVSGAWVAPPTPDSLAGGEEEKPLSPASYQEYDGRSRRLMIGLVPVGDRERLVQAQQPSPASQPALPPPIDPRQMALKGSVIGPLKNLQDVADAAFASANNPLSNPPATADQQQAMFKTANDQIQQVSWYVLLDLARFFESWIPDFWQAIQANPSAPAVSGAQLALWKTLSNTSFKGLSLANAMLNAYAAATTLEAIKTTYDSQSPAGWPTFQFSFYQASFSGTQGLTPDLSRDTFEALIASALPPTSVSPPLPTRAIAQANANVQGQMWFTIRCVLERPNCGALTPPFVSEPTVAFQMAPYFDSDAPARPIRIGLPIDTTPAGLRKFDRNTAFVMSDTLCGQVNKLSGTSFANLVLSVLPFPFNQPLSSGGGAPCGSGGVSFGMVCSFSIPIITICALILLIIFVKLLDIIFFWMPFFQICLPLPNFSAKES
jgi:hypothetical protein